MGMPSPEAGHRDDSARKAGGPPAVHGPAVQHICISVSGLD